MFGPGIARPAGNWVIGGLFLVCLYVGKGNYEEYHIAGDDGYNAVCAGALGGGGGAEVMCKGSAEHKAGNGDCGVGIAFAGKDQLTEGQPPRSTEPQPTMPMPRKFMMPSLWATG